MYYYCTHTASTPKIRLVVVGKCNSIVMKYRIAVIHIDKYNIQSIAHDLLRNKLFFLFLLNELNRLSLSRLEYILYFLYFASCSASLKRFFSTTTFLYASGSCLFKCNISRFLFWIVAYITTARKN